VRCEEGQEELVDVWTRSMSIAEKMVGWVEIAEIQFGLTGVGLLGMKNSDFLLRLAVGIEYQLKTYDWIRGQGSKRELNLEYRI
jgi:hypothetical protein